MDTNADDYRARQGSDKSADDLAQALAVLPQAEADAAPEAEHLREILPELEAIGLSMEEWLQLRRIARETLEAQRREEGAREREEQEVENDNTVGSQEFAWMMDRNNDRHRAQHHLHYAGSSYLAKQAEKHEHKHSGFVDRVKHGHDHGHSHGH